MARSSEKSPLLKSPVPEKLPFPLGLVSPGVRPYLELIRFHKVRAYIVACVGVLRHGAAYWDHPHVLAVW